MQLAEHPAQVIGRVFAVDQQPVKPGIGRQLGAVGIGQAEPQADLRLAAAQALLEAVDGHIHGTVLQGQTKRQEIEPSMS